MTSADAWHDDSSLEAQLALSVEIAQAMKEADVEAAKERHPSGKAVAARNISPDVSGIAKTMDARDRCDGCSSAALYRLGKDGHADLSLCHHHGHRHADKLEENGWSLIDHNASLMQELYNSNRLQGEDHG